MALKFVQENKIVPASFATEAFFSNDSFVFVNKAGVKRPGRYQILPLAGLHELTAEEAKSKPADFLMEDLKAHLATEPVKYRLVVQLPNPGDTTKDPSLVWPNDRTTVELGIISVVSHVPNSAAVESDLAFAPGKLVEGIEFSDDPLPALRSKVYTLAVRHRQVQADNSSTASK